MKKYISILLPILLILTACGKTTFDFLELENGEIIENDTNGIIAFATHKDSVGNASLAGTRAFLSFSFDSVMVKPQAGAFFVGDTDNVFLPVQDFRLERMTITANRMAAGDTVIIRLYDGVANSPSIVAFDSLTEAEVLSTTTQLVNFDISTATDGFALWMLQEGTPGHVTVILQGKYYDHR